MKESRLKNRVTKKSSDVKPSNLNITSKAQTAKPVPVRLPAYELNILTNAIDDFSEDYANLTRSDLIKAGVRLLAKVNRKDIIKALDNARSGKSE